MQHYNYIITCALLMVAFLPNAPSPSQHRSRRAAALLPLTRLPLLLRQLRQDRSRQQLLCIPSCIPCVLLRVFGLWGQLVSLPLPLPAPLLPALRGSTAFCPLGAGFPLLFLALPPPRCFCLSRQPAGKGCAGDANRAPGLGTSGGSQAVPLTAPIPCILHHLSRYLPQASIKMHHEGWPTQSWLKSGDTLSLSARCQHHEITPYLLLAACSSDCRLCTSVFAASNDTSSGRSSSVSSTSLERWGTPLPLPMLLLRATTGSSMVLLLQAKPLRRPDASASCRDQVDRCRDQLDRCRDQIPDFLSMSHESDSWSLKSHESQHVRKKPPGKPKILSSFLCREMP